MRKLLFIAVVLILVVAGLIGSGYLASQHVDASYQQALEVEVKVQHERSDAMLQRAAALSNDLRREGTWKAIFTADQINGWLAVDMIENHPDLLPAEVTDPRVTITPERLTLFFRYADENVTSILSLVTDIYLDSPNVVAVRFDKARAGVLPMPMRDVIEHVKEAAAEADLHIEWRQTSGDPVALVHLAPRSADGRFALKLESLTLGDGELFVAGHTEPIDPGISTENRTPVRLPSWSHSASNSSDQR